MGKFRLLSKREVDAQKAKERQREVQEGSKLAKRVDDLRQLGAAEEKGLDQFRIKQLTQIQQEIDPKLEELAILNTTIQTRKDELKILNKPLTEKWTEVKAKEVQVKSKEESVVQSEGQLKLSIAANIQRERNNEIERQQIADERSRSTENLVQSERLHEETKKTLKEAREKSDVMNAALELREKEVRVREVNVFEKGKKNKEYFDNLVKYEQKLFLDDLQIKDRWRELLKTEQEHGNDTKRSPKKGR